MVTLIVAGNSVKRENAGSCCPSGPIVGGSSHQCSHPLDDEEEGKLQLDLVCCFYSHQTRSAISLFQLSF